MYESKLVHVAEGQCYGTYVRWNEPQFDESLPEGFYFKAGDTYIKANEIAPGEYAESDKHSYVGVVDEKEEVAL